MVMYPGYSYQPAGGPRPFQWGAIPDVMGSLRGVRIWRWWVEDNVLSSAAKDIVWPIGALLEAVCLNDQVKWKKIPGGLVVKRESSDHEAVPQPDCSCGIWGLYDLYRDADKTWKPGTDYGKVVYVSGVIEASGRIVEGSIGFRAQRAKIVSLCSEGVSSTWEQGFATGIESSKRERSFKWLAEKYQLPVSDTLPVFEKPTE